ncbi:MAG: ABC transporter permease subunit [Verrucomicrobiota bacterium]
MTLLPIADRELRVAARAKATHRWRISFAVGAVGIAAALGLISLASGGLLVSQLGVYTFGALKWIGFVFACAAGTFLTADCLSEEKREGTMGLLFLTDLRGHDVVLGKLLATSLRSFYGLLAVFPVMAFSFILGGVAADDFRHALIALCNTVFFSLALGMVISVLSRDPHKAMTGSLTAMAGFLFLTPGLDWLILRRNANNALIGLLSPAYAFTQTSSYRAAGFWLSTITVHLAGWSFLALACWLAPKTWRQKALRRGIGSDWRIPFFTPSGAQRLRDQSPICWLISRDRWASNLARLSVVIILGVFLLSMVSYSQSPRLAAAAPVMKTTMTSSTTTNSTGGVAYSYTASVSSTSVSFKISSWFAGALALALEFWLASQVSRFYVDGKRSGFLELLLVTPVRPAEVVQGHWHALRNLFLAPMATLLFLNLAVGTFQILSMPAGAPLLGVLGGATVQALVLVLSQTAWVTGLFAIAWFSIWMGLASQRISVAVLKTFCYVKILPWFGVYFAMGLSAFLLFRMFNTATVWVMIAMPQMLIIGANFILIRLARRGVQVDFSRWANS